MEGAGNGSGVRAMGASGASLAAALGAALTNEVPHSAQNLAAGGLCVPHSPQVFISAAGAGGVDGGGNSTAGGGVEGGFAEERARAPPRAAAPAGAAPTLDGAGGLESDGGGARGGIFGAGTGSGGV